MPYIYDDELIKIKQHAWFFTHGQATLQVGQLALQIGDNEVEVEEHEYHPDYILKIAHNSGAGKVVVSPRQHYSVFLSEKAYSAFRQEIEETWDTLPIKGRFPNLPFKDFDEYAARFYHNVRQGVSVNRVRELDWYLYQDDEMQRRYPDRYAEIQLRRNAGNG